MSVDQRPKGQHLMVRASMLKSYARPYPAGFREDFHSHREAQILYASHGVMQVSTPKGRWLVPPELAVWLPAGLVHAVDMLGDVEMRALYIAADWLTGLTLPPRLENEAVVRVSPFLRELIMAQFRDGQTDERVAMLAHVALLELAEAEDAAMFIALPHDARARRAAEFVLSESGMFANLEDLAEFAGGSRRTLSRLFAAETGMPFKAWRQRARIVRAMMSIGSGQTSIKRLARDLGYASTSSFIQAFREVSGQTPGEYIISQLRS